ncbi:MAG: UDP-N-acetylglucosamine 1-carboxyvinyltransferase, partial [Planctomycetota bacterium]|nr:UDP-N-acetylglucosamine 1-carboxyvinyltransferase [Planctomycetota bacterium]
LLGALGVEIEGRVEAVTVEEQLQEQGEDRAPAASPRSPGTGAEAWRLRSAERGPTEAPYEIVRRMRASICVLGPLLARRGRARVPLPGGCVFGPRPVDLHVRAMEALGARIALHGGVLEAEAPPDGLRGACVELRSPSGSTVLGTANLMMAATLARGETRILCAAREPEIIALAEWLRACGANIEGEGTDEIRIEGVRVLHARPMRVPPDRIETGTLLIGAAITRGCVRINGARPRDLSALCERLEASGVRVRSASDWIEADARGVEARATDVRTAPHPGFPTDLQAQWTAYACTLPGVTRVRDEIYPERFMHVPELMRLGARIERAGDTAVVAGGGELAAAPVVASDLRASAALVLAGLVARGRTVVRRVYHLDRGYEALESKLAALGARVARAPDDQRP